MLSQTEKANQFSALHIKGKPLVLFNIWDAGSARILQEAGAQAIATGSASVAGVHGYGDGEALPFNLVIANIQRIVAAVDLPVSLDAEGGYARDLETLFEHTSRILETGTVGINFEDQIIGTDALYSIEEQCQRIAAIRRSAEAQAVPLFINARTDIFLKAKPDTHNESHLAEAIERAQAYAEAGASGYFVPGLRKSSLISQLCEESSLPVNILAFPDAPSASELAQLGVARISHGPFPYRQMLAALKQAAQAALA